MEKQQEFQSDLITFTAEHKENCIVEYRVKVDPKIVQKARQKAIRSIGKEVSIPGFRKGKAPDTLIVKKYSEPLKERWQKALADEVFPNCQNLSKIPLLNHETQITFNIDKLSVDEGGEITYLFETEPEIPAIDLEKIQLTKEPRKTIDTKEIDKSIHDIQLYFATWSPVSNRAAQENDFVIVDIDVIEEDPPQRALTNTRFKVDEEHMAKWMRELVIGMAVGEAKEGVSIPDEDAEEKHKQENPPKKVRLILKKIEIATLPPVDDALATQVGTQSVQEMRENLEKLLNRQEEESVQKAYRKQINDHLLKHCHFDLPKSLLDKESEFRIKQLIKDPMSHEKLLKMSTEEQKKTIQEIQTQGANAIRLFYIARKIVEEQNIQISPNEVHQEVKTPLEALFSHHSDFYSPNEQSQEQRAIALSRLVLMKAEDFLISKATIRAPEIESKQGENEQEEKTSEKKMDES